MQPQTDYPTPSSPVQSDQLQIPTSAPDPSLAAQNRTSDITFIEHSSQQSLSFDKPADDGCNWQMYTPKKIQDSKFSEVHYKCPSGGCLARKVVKRSLDGQVTEIILGGHYPICPQNTNGKNRDSTANLSGSSVNNSCASYNLEASQYQTSSSNKTKRMQQKAASDSEEVDNGKTSVKEEDEDEPNPKRRAQILEYWEPKAGPSDKSITESRVIVQTTSEVDALDDGYRWRPRLRSEREHEKGNPNPGMYYVCSTYNCPARKHVDIAATETYALATTYKGKHNHDPPAAKSSSHDKFSGYTVDGSSELEKVHHDFSRLRGHSSYISDQNNANMSIKPGILPLIPSTVKVLPLLPKTLQPSFLKLRFINSPPPVILKNSRIEAEDGSPIKIELIDEATNTRVTSDLLSFARLEIVPLHSDIGKEFWTTEEFNRNILCSREGKQPLLVGDLIVTLKDGVGVMGGYNFFTDNSSWLRSGKFRLGAKATEGGAVEAITEAFVCKDHPGESYEKHYPPYPDSEVWRLDNISKDSFTELCLRKAGIHTVKDLRRHLSISQNTVPRELEGNITKKRWNDIVFHSMHCILDESERYIYNSEVHGSALLFNSVYEVMKVSFDRVTVLYTTDLTSTQQALLDNLKHEAYKNTTSFIAVNSADFASFLPRSSKNLLDADLNMGFSVSQRIYVEGASTDASDGFELLSTSVKLSTSKYYDVVIRYGRRDTNNDDFISHLRAALCRRGISVYEEFDEADAVPECRVLIMLLTSTYVPSDLLNILEHQQIENRVVYPIFYRLSPNDLISNIKNYEKFFLQDEPERWQPALKETTQMAGYTLTDKSESELIDEIVRDALKVLCSGDKVNMIGMDMQVEEILSLLHIEALDVRSIGIWGTVGIGKTTIAKEIFCRISVQYETCLFLKDFHKEVEEKGQDAVREEFLSKVLDVAPHIIRISDIKTSFLRSRLQHKKVLIVLDDVNDYRDVETVLWKLNYFGPGSRIIITSRNRRVFLLCKTDHVYEVKPLDIPSSLLLLGCGTSQNGLSPEVYRKMSLELVKFSNGNPQVLQFLSSNARGWNSLLQEIQTTSSMHIPDIFERICDGLDENERSIFLDIACFFNRMDKDNVAMLLDGCGFSAHVGFRSLVDKSLLNISQHNMVDMLSFIQATGREIVRQESADNPGDQSRLCNAEDIRDVFLDDTGTSAIEGIFLDMSNLKYDANPNVFEKMCNLRLLKLYCSKMEEKHGVSFPQGLQYLPRKLRLLHWEYYPFSSLPKSFNPEKLVELNLSNSCAKKLWKGKKSLEKLKKMRLSYSYQLTEIPRLSGAPNLEHIDLEGCNSLISISQSISHLKKLVFLNLKDCSKLESIPSMVDLVSLEVLNFSGCSKLQNFPEISPNVKELYMGGTMVHEIPSSIKNLVMLEKLNLENSRHLKNLPTSISKLKHLETLNLSGCTSLDQFPDLTRKMKCLRFLDLRRTAIKELPSSISYLTSLEEMRFVNSRISRGYLVSNKAVAVGDDIKGLRSPVLKPSLALKRPPIDLQRKSWDSLAHFAPKSESVKRPSLSSSIPTRGLSSSGPKIIG